MCWGSSCQPVNHLRHTLSGLSSHDRCIEGGVRIYRPPAQPRDLCSDVAGNVLANPFGRLTSGVLRFREGGRVCVGALACLTCTFLSSLRHVTGPVLMRDGTLRSTKSFVFVVFSLRHFQAAMKEKITLRCDETLRNMEKNREYNDLCV